MTSSAIALGRATLARQILLEREDRDHGHVDHLVGLQAQVPHNPYTALWSRLDPFDPEALSRLLSRRLLVRIVTLRSTPSTWSPRTTPAAAPAGPAGPRRRAGPPPDLRPVARRRRPRRGHGRRQAAAGRAASHRPPAPGAHGRAVRLEHRRARLACRNRLALVQVPPRGLGAAAARSTTTAEAWLGRPLETEPSIDAAVLRYLAAFGPATVADVATWSRLTGFREVLDRLRLGCGPSATSGAGSCSTCRRFPARPRHPGPRPLPARVRQRAAQPRRPIPVPRSEDRDQIAALFVERGLGSVLSDGMGRAVWRSLDRSPAGDRPSSPCARSGSRTAVARRDEAEASRLLAFLAPGAPAEVRVVASDGGANVTRT